MAASASSGKSRPARKRRTSGKPPRQRGLRFESLERRDLLSTVRFDDPQAIIGDVLDFSVSADGRYAVYVDDDQPIDAGELALYSVATESGQVTRLDSDSITPTTHFKVSPGGTHVVFTGSANDVVFELYSVPIAGGEITKLNGPLEEGATVSERAFELSSDNARVVYAADEDGDESLDLFSVPLTGGDVAKFDRLPDIDQVTGRFAISPDDTRVVYETRRPTQEREVYSIPIVGGDPVRLTRGNPQDFRVTPDSEHMIYTAFRRLSTQLFSVPITGGAAIPLSGDLISNAAVSEFHVSSDSDQIVYRGKHDSEAEELFVVPVLGGSRSKLNSPLNDGASVTATSLSSDDSTVVYTISGPAGATLHTVPVGGGASSQLSEVAGVVNFRISSDSQRVVFTGGDAVAELYSIPLLGGDETKLNGPLASETSVGAFKIGADSNRVLYDGMETGDDTRLLRSVPIDGGETAVVGTNLEGGHRFNQLEIVQDQVFYLAAPSGRVTQLYSAPLIGGESLTLNSPLQKLGGEVRFVQVSPNGEYAVYSADHEVERLPQLFSVELATGVRRELETLGGSVGGFQISPDSRFVIFTTGGGRRLLSTSITGSDSTIIADVSSSGGRVLQSRFTSDSMAVVFRADGDVRGVFELYSVPLGGGDVVKLNAPLATDEEIKDDFAVSPDSRRVVYWTEQASGLSELFSVRVDGNDRVRLNPPLHADTDFGRSWSISEDSKWVVYQSDHEADQVFELFSVPIAGGDFNKLNGPLVAGGHVHDFGFEISPDSTRVIYIVSEDDSAVRELYSVPITGGESIKLNPQLAPFGGNVIEARFAPDGNFVVYRADQDRRDRIEIYSIPALGGESTKLNQSIREHIGSRFQITPDSSRVIFDSVGFSENVIYSTSITGGDPVMLSGSLVDHDVAASRISKDSLTLLFAAAEQDSARGVYQVPLSGGAATRVNEAQQVDSFFFSDETSTVVYRANAALFGTTVERDDSAQLLVNSWQPTATGFELQLSNAIDPQPLNLYDAALAALGPADVTLRGDVTGPVSGSLIVDDSGRQLTFVKSDGILPADDYRLTVRSGFDGLRTEAGRRLDGNGDRLAGDAFEARFTIEPSSHVVGLPDVVRGPGQEVNLPVGGAGGIPLTFASNEAINSLEFRIAYDPEMLQLGEVVAAPAMPDGAEANVAIESSGLVTISFSTPVALPPGDHVFALLEANVPDQDGIYGRLQLLDVHAITMRDSDGNVVSAMDNDAVHLATFLGDVSADRRVDDLDSESLARVAASLDSGFASTLLADPAIVGDISGNGRLNPFDVSLVAQAAAMIDVPQIPPFPALTDVRLDDPRAPAGDVLDYRFSSDGQFMFYVADAELDHQNDLYRLELSTGDVVKLNDPEEGAVVGFRVATDGRTVVYLAQNADDYFDLYSVSTTDSARTRLNREFALGRADVAGPPRPTFDISEDSSQVVYRGDEQGNGAFDLYSVPIEGGESVRLNLPPTSSRTVLEFQISGDSRYVIYNSNQDRHNFDLYRVPLHGGEIVRLTTELPTTVDVGRFKVGPNSRYVTYEAEGALLSVPITGGDSASLNEGRFDRRDEWEISPDGTHVVTVETVADRLSRVPIAGGDPVVLVESDRLTSEIKFTPESNRVIYRTDLSELFVLPIAGGTPRRLNNFQDSYLPAKERFQISTDGEWVSYEGGQSIHAVRLAGGESITLVEQLPGQRESRRISFAPDASGVGFLSAGPGGITELYSVPISGGAPEKLNVPLTPLGDGVTDALPSPDGQFVVYRADHDTDDVFELYSSATATGEIAKLNLTSGLDVEPDFQISADGRWVIFRHHQVYSVPISGGTPILLSEPIQDIGREVVQFQVSGDNVFFRPEARFEGLFSAPVTGGETLVLSDQDVAEFQVTRDVDRIVYLAEGLEGDELFSVTLDGGDRQKLNGPLVRSGDVLDFRIASGGTRVVYRAEQEIDRVADLYSVPTAGGEFTKLNQRQTATATAIVQPLGNQDVGIQDVGVLSGGLDGVSQYKVSPDGQHVIFMADQEQLHRDELYHVSITGGANTKLNEGSSRIVEFEISPESTRVVYRTFTDLFSVPLGGGAVTALDAPRFSAVRPGIAFGLQGSHVIYNADGNLYRVPVEGGESMQLNPVLVAGGEVQGGHRITPDGRSVVYRADQDSDDVMEFYLVSIAGGDFWRLNGPLVKGGDVLQFTVGASGTDFVYLADQDVNRQVGVYWTEFPGRWPRPVALRRSEG